MTIKNFIDWHFRTVHTRVILIRLIGAHSHKRDAHLGASRHYSPQSRTAKFLLPAPILMQAAASLRRNDGQPANIKVADSQPPRSSATMMPVLCQWFVTEILRT